MSEEFKKFVDENNDSTSFSSLNSDELIGGVVKIKSGKKPLGGVGFLEKWKIRIVWNLFWNHEKLKKLKI